jgi:hypothetical protein
MKTLKIIAMFFIIWLYASINANAQVTHFREVTRSPITNEYFDCIDVSLSGEQVLSWFWSYDPIDGYNVQIKIDVTLVGTDGKNYTAHQIWNERINMNENENKLNYVGRWCSTEQLKCEGKLVGLVRLSFHFTLPASCEDPDYSVYFDRTEINCK